EFKKAIIDVITEGKKGLHRYMPNPGYPFVRDKIAVSLNNNGYFEGITGDSIIMTVGAAGGINVILNAIVDTNDEIILLKPFFVDYAKYVSNYGGNPVFVDTDEDFGVDIGKIESAVTTKTKAIIINTPNNPTGRVYTDEKLKNLADLLERKSINKTIYLISDEPYREIIFSGNKYYSPCTFYKNSFMVYSWSKSLSIPGERIGYIALNPKMKNIDEIFKGLTLSLRILGFVNSPALMQNVIARILDIPFDLKHYEEKRNILFNCLVKNGYELTTPEGGFYMFIKYPVSDEQFLKIARESLLLVVPGDAFGVPTHFRISFCLDTDTIKKACEKFENISNTLRL
ncbi:pyridoxal phosphate-dependent aminotransferase, partial [candidate division KSB1 bacterium]